MAKRRFIRSFKKTFRTLRSKNHFFAILSVALIGGLVVYGMFTSRTMINPTAYTPLLTVIAKGESHGNYNAYFGNVNNEEVRFTEMTLGEVLDWQASYVAQGNPSNAVGRYQIIRPTLEQLIKDLDLSLDTIFSEALQDKLAIALIERRGALAYINHDLSTEDFSHNLSKEWAALPKIHGDSPEASYYEGDGLNKAQVPSESILNAAEAFKNRARQK